ncbi:SBBP repeat-containing protein [Myxococcota bacterium]|nr:SBBP repeat-containing protein [Myxococcota bacterium]
MRLLSFGSAPLAALLVLAGCQSAEESLLDEETSLYALVEAADGVAIYPPLGPQPGPMVGPFDATLLDAVVVHLESVDANGVERVVATFDRTTTPPVQRKDQFSSYFVNVPAAAYITDRARSYRFRVTAGDRELVRSDLSSIVFDVLARVPTLRIGVKVRVEVVLPSCTDQRRNGAETGIDCGGACAPCPDGAACVVAADCENSVCTGGVCQMASCTDGVKNGAESDLDCGGACTTCAVTARCASNGDCATGVCANGLCQPPTCTDGVANGDETGVDCGGACAVPESCNGVDDDCNGTIDEGLGTITCGLGACQVTVPACAQGQTVECTPGAPAPEACDGVDNDCNGVADEGCECIDGRTQPCYDGAQATLGVGECRGGIRTCVRGQWGACAGEVTPRAESCNGLDDDCDGALDEDLGTTICGAGACRVAVDNCVAGQVQVCIPSAPSAEACNGVDDDCDGAIDDGNPGGGVACSTGGAGVCAAGTTSCTGVGLVCQQDAQPSTEVCNGSDDDCDGAVDESVATIFYRDGDGDGYGSAIESLRACSLPSGYVTNNLDCDDARFSVRPGGAEVCNGLDDNCNGLSDELVTITYYRDVDGDGYGNAAVATQACAQPAGYAANGSDCNDGNVMINPDAEEVCNGADDDCNGQVDEGDPGGGVACVTGLPGTCSGGTTHCQAGAIVCTQNVVATWYPDDDGDGYGTSGGTTSGCTRPTGYAAVAGDCDDADPDLNPGELEVCDGLDNDCDTQVDDNPYNPPTWYADGDGDGYGTTAATRSQCTQPAGYVASAGDCNDASAAVSPASAELCNGLDDNCNSVADEGNPGGGVACTTGLSGMCASGSTACFAGGVVCNQTFASTAEVCDSLDNDCDGASDEGNVCGCVPGTTQPCYSGAGGTLGVGICAAGVMTCNAQGSGYGACTGQVVPQGENCATSADENCDGATPPCTGAGSWSRRMGSTSADLGYWTATDSRGAVYVAGSFQGTVDFGGGNLVSAGGYDAFLAKYDASGAFLWAKRFGSTSTDHGYRVAVDPNDNVILSGTFNGTVNFGGGNLVSAGGYDIFLVKFDTLGTYQWSRRYGSTSTDYGWGLATDSAGNVIASGMYNGTVNFGGGNLASAGGYDIYLLKLDAAGTFVWARRFGGTSTDYGYSVAVDASDNILMTGTFNGTVGFGGANLVSAGSYEIFVAKFNSAGTHQWSNRYGGTSSDYGYSIATDGSNVYVTGIMRGTVSFGGASFAMGSYYDSFLLKLNASGVHQWSRQVGRSAYHDYGYGVACDRVGNVVFTGYFRSTASFGAGTLTSAGSYDAYLAKLDPAGNQIWAQRFGDASAQYGRGVAIDPANNVVTVGYFAGTVNLTGTTLSSAGSNEIYVAKFAP